MASANIDLVTGRKKKKRKAGDEVGKGSQKSDEAEESTPENAVH